MDRKSKWKNQREDSSRARQLQRQHRFFLGSGRVCPELKWKGQCVISEPYLCGESGVNTGSRHPSPGEVGMVPPLSPHFPLLLSLFTVVGEVIILALKERVLFLSMLKENGSFLVSNETWTLGNSASTPQRPSASGKHFRQESYFENVLALLLMSALVRLSNSVFCIPLPFHMYSTQARRGCLLHSN